MALRSRIVLAAAEGRSNQRIASDLGIPEVTVGKWRRSFAALGLEGLGDAPRSGRPPKHDASVWLKVQTLACQQPPSQSRWSVRTLAREVGLPHSTVHAILHASELQLHRIRTFTFSPDPDFEAKLLDIVGLYLSPPEDALVLCVDEKTGIQALDRTQPLLPLRANKPRSWTNEYVRHGTQTLIAALEIATGKVVAHIRNRRTSVNFLRFMNDVVGAYPDRELHVVADNLNIHKNEAARRWLGRHPRVRFHYTPTHASWVNLVECFFSILSKQALAHSVQRSKRDLKALLQRFLANYNATCSPFTWTKGPAQLQRIIESTKEYQAAHPRKSRRRPKRKHADSIRN
ncbi:MAG: IS630 family transposase [Acidobacteria bacterium]|nr:IS630 family transposase [Acidobacteriota bacterium]